MAGFTWESPGCVHPDCPWGEAFSRPWGSPTIDCWANLPGCKYRFQIFIHLLCDILDFKLVFSCSVEFEIFYFFSCTVKLLDIILYLFLQLFCANEFFINFSGVVWNDIFYFFYFLQL